MNNKIYPSKIKSKFILLTERRSGSHLLSNLINSNPSFYTAGECLAYDQRLKEFKKDKEIVDAAYNADFDTLLKSRFKEKYNELTAMHCGFILHRSHLRLKPEIENLLRNNRDLKYIVLKRKNHLERFVSHSVAAKIQSFGCDNDLHQDKIPKLNIEPMNLFHFIHEHDTDYDTYLNLLRSLSVKVLEISYEELCERQCVTMNKVFSFLGEGDFSVTTTKIKQIKKSMGEIIENYNELELILSNKLAFNNYKRRAALQVKNNITPEDMLGRREKKIKEGTNKSQHS